MKRLIAISAAVLGVLLAVPACVAAPPQEMAQASQGQVLPAGHCHDCGTVTNIDTVSREGKASGAGAVIGAVIGGVVGHQFGGSDRSRDAATAAGAVGGAAAGHHIEKSRQPGTVAYRVTVQMDGGGARVFEVPQLNGLDEGRRVKVVGGNNLQMIG